MKRLVKNNWIAAAVLIAVVLGTSWSLLNSHFFIVHDYTHGARIAEMMRALQDGQFPVRWVSNFGFGYGMPLFEFYGPLPFYFGGILFWLGLDLVWSIKTLILAANIGTVLGGYLLGRELARKNKIEAGLISAAVLTLAPYRAVNLFVRGAINETWALMFFSWILWSIVRVVKCKKRAWIGLTLGLTGLFLSHNISILIFFPAALILTGLLWWSFQISESSSFNKQRLITAVKQLFLSGFLAFGLSSFYLLPAYFQKQFTQVDQIILGDYFDYHLHFLYLRQLLKPSWGYGGSEWGPNDGISFFLGYGQLLLIIFSSLLVLLMLLAKLLPKKQWFLRFENKQLRRSLKLAASVLTLMAAVILITTQKTLVIWDNISLLAYIQFPWRFLMLVVLLTSVLAAVVISSLKRHSWLLTVLVLLLTIGLNFQYFQPEKYVDQPDKIYYSSPQRIRTEMSTVLPDYIPSAMPNWHEIEPVQELILNPNQLGKDNFQILADRSHQKLIEVNFDVPQTIELAIASYPGWTASTPVHTAENGNLILTDVQGTEKIAVRYIGTPLVRASNVVSLVSLCVFAGSVLKTNFNIRHD